MPARKDVGVEVFGIRAEDFDDLGVGEAVAEHEVEFFADGEGEAADIAGMAPRMG